ncbi:MAG: hypothetical protein HC888_16910 [Candidatus Competibacteraceae bacterium]|nr:hypothetical protein [Candidatus Competibacteraceae bacterium]
MKKQYIPLFMLLAVPAALSARRDRVDFAEDVQFSEADASPTPYVSNINEYTFQDEQINIEPEDGDVRVLRTDQKILMNEFVTALIPLNAASPRELRGPIRTMVRKEGGEADVVQDKVTGKNYLHVVCPPFQLPYVQAVMNGLDEAWVRERLDGSGELYYKARFRDIRKVQRISQFYIGPEGMGRFVFDDLNNAMYYTDQPALIGLQTWGLGQIDIPPNQVELEVKVYEIDMNNDTQLGLDYADWKNGPGRNFFEIAYAMRIRTSTIMHEHAGYGNGVGVVADYGERDRRVAVHRLRAEQGLCDGTCRHDDHREERRSGPDRSD